MQQAHLGGGFQCVHNRCNSKAFQYWYSFPNEFLPHSPGTSWTWSKWNSSRVQQHRSHNISETEWTWERTVVRYLRTASSAQKRSKVIGGIVNAELKKESRTIFTSEAVGYFFVGRRALSLPYTRQHSSLWAQSSQSDKVDLWSWITRLHNRAMRCWVKSKTIPRPLSCRFFSIKLMAVWRHWEKHTMVLLTKLSAA